MAVAQAFFDESGTDSESKFLCMAGYIFEKENAIALDAQWQSMLVTYELPYFHMSECAHNIGVYCHLSMARCDQAARDAIELIGKYATHGIAVSLEKEVFHLLAGGHGDLFQNPYSFMCWQVLYGIRDWRDANHHDEKIACVYENGANGRGNFLDAWGRIFRDPDATKEMGSMSLTFLEKENAIPLQCADMLAWHWFTYNRRKAQGNKNPIRKDFRALLDAVRVDAHHYGAAEIDGWLSDNYLNR